MCIRDSLRADQTIGGTALNMLAPALVLFLIRVIANQNTLQMLSGEMCIRDSSGRARAAVR